MIISGGRGYVFVHIPKTGGTSLASALEARAMRDDILIGDTPKARRRRRRLEALQARGRIWKHATLADIDGVLTAADLEQMFCFTLVRNPWDRVVSYYHWLRAQSFAHPDVARAQAQNFTTFVQDTATRAAFAASPARHYMTDATGQVRCNAYIRLEYFETDAAPLFAHLGFAVTLPHLNRSRRDADYRDSYTPAARDAVADFCAEDIARFDYHFDAQGQT